MDLIICLEKFSKILLLGRIFDESNKIYISDLS